MAAAFNARVHANPDIQAAVGLNVVVCDPPARGNRTCLGQMGPNQLSSMSVQQTFTTEQAGCILNMIPDASKDDPPDDLTRESIAKLALQAGQNVPDGCQVDDDDEEDPLHISFIITPGSPILQNKKQANKLISYVFMNQDNAHRVLWADMTGREQYEWVNSWERSGRSHVRQEGLTRGLRGTDLVGRITDRAQLQAALGNSPSLRRRRPDGHPNLTVNDWDEIARQLPF